MKIKHFNIFLPYWMMWINFAWVKIQCTCIIFLVRGWDLETPVQSLEMFFTVYSSNPRPHTPPDQARCCQWTFQLQFSMVGKLIKVGARNNSASCYYVEHMASYALVFFFFSDRVSVWRFLLCSLIPLVEIALFEILIGSSVQCGQR